MADTTVRGRFVWHELITSEGAAAHSFYTKALGWRTQAWDLDPDYTMFLAASGPLGGTVVRPSDTPRWLPYIGTDHIEGTVDQARSLGARVVQNITEMKSGGKYAVLEDPQGAAFGVYISPSEPSPEGTPKLGEFSWHELATTDYRSAFDFYSALFGWEEVSQHDMGEPLGVYFTFGRNGKAIGGIYKATPEMPGPFWLGYVRVKDLQQTVKKVKSSGGTVITEPMEVPGGDLIAQFNDPQGATFAAHMFAADIKVPAPPQLALALSAAEPTATESEPESARDTNKPAAKKVTKKAAKKTSGGAAKQTAKKKAAGAVAKAGAKKSGAKKAKKAAKKKVAKKSSKAAKKTKAASKKRSAAARSSKRPVRRAVKRPAGKSAKCPAKKKAVKRARKAK